MLEKKIILIIAGVCAFTVAYMVYAIYKNYPETTNNNTQEGAEG